MMCINQIIINYKDDSDHKMRTLAKAQLTSQMKETEDEEEEKRQRQQQASPVIDRTSSSS